MTPCGVQGGVHPYLATYQPLALRRFREAAELLDRNATGTCRCNADSVRSASRLQQGRMSEDARPRAGSPHQLHAHRTHRFPGCKRRGTSEQDLLASLACRIHDDALQQTLRSQAQYTDK